MAARVTVLNAVTRLLPFPVSPGDEKEMPREELRLKHRVLDLRCVACPLLLLPLQRCYCLLAQPPV